MSKGNFIFITIILPLGVILALYSSDIAKLLSELFELNVTTSDFGVFYLLSSVILMVVFKENKKKEPE